MTYHIAICDDSQADADYIASLAEKWAQKDNIYIKIDRFPSAEAFLFHYAEDKTYDILLLDVEMGEMNGVELAHTIRKDNSTVQIVFITGYSDYISAGYDVAALHYLVKPVDESKLFTVLSRAKDMLIRQERRIVLSVAGETVRIPLHEVSFVEVQGNYVTIHAEQEYTVKATLGTIEKQLDESFFRTGRSYIINLGYIRRVSKNQVELSDGMVLPLPRGVYEPLNRAIINQT